MRKLNKTNYHFASKMVLLENFVILYEKIFLYTMLKEIILTPLYRGSHWTMKEQFENIIILVFFSADVTLQDIYSALRRIICSSQCQDQLGDNYKQPSEGSIHRLPPLIPYIKLFYKHFPMIRSFVYLP